jgi:hypothetical protein
MLQKKQSGNPAAFFIGRITYNSQKDLRVVCIPPSFSCPKEGARKRHPDCPGPSGSLVLLAVAGTLETHRLQRDRIGTKKQKRIGFQSHFTQPSSATKCR